MGSRGGAEFSLLNPELRLKLCLDRELTPTTSDRVCDRAAWLATMSPAHRVVVWDSTSYAYYQTTVTTSRRVCIGLMHTRTMNIMHTLAITYRYTS